MITLTPENDHSEANGAVRKCSITAETAEDRGERGISGARSGRTKEAETAETAVFRTQNRTFLQNQATKGSHIENNM